MLPYLLSKSHPLSFMLFDWEIKQMTLTMFVVLFIRLDYIFNFKRENTPIERI